MHRSGSEHLKRVLDGIPGWTEKVDAFGRGGSETFILLNVEIARLDGIIKSKADLGLRMLVLACSAIVAYAPRISTFVHENPNTAVAILSPVTSVAFLIGTVSACKICYKYGIALDGDLLQAILCGACTVALCFAAVAALADDSIDQGAGDSTTAGSDSSGSVSN